MNKRIAYPILVALVFLGSCIIDDTRKPGMSKCSQSIQESKTHGVFAFEVHADNPVINIGDGKTDTIIESWVEHHWMYTNNGSITMDSSLQILFLLQHLSKTDAFESDIWFKDGGRYWGWNGVLFSNYDNHRDFLVVKKTNGIDLILDTVFYRRDQD